MKYILLSALLVLFVAHTPVFSQCTDGEEDKVLLVGDSWAFFMGVDQTLNDVFTQWGHSDKRFFTNLTLAENGAETIDFLQQNKQDEIEQQLLDRPSIDFVHLSIGGNDVLGSWNTNMTQAQTDSIKNSVRDSITEVIDFIQSVRPGIQVVWSGYCYSNFAEVIESQLIPSIHPFYGTWENMNFPDNQTINVLLNEFTDLMAATYQNDPNVHVIPATGLMQYTYGQIDPLEIAPFGTYPAFTAPLTEGFVDYPSPQPSMRNYGVTKDCFHLSVQGYEDLISYHMQKYYHKAMMNDRYFIAQNNSTSGSVSSNGDLDTLLKLGDSAGEQFETILTFETQGQIDSIVEEASLFLFIKEQIGTTPLDENLIIKIKNGSFGQSMAVEIDDYGVNGSYQAVPCIFGDNQNGRWVRLDLPGQLLPFITGVNATQIKLTSPEGNGAYVEFGGLTDPEFAPVLDITFGNQSLVQVPTESLTEVVAYPNPTKDIITIDVGESHELKEISIYNLLGGVIANSGASTIDLSHLPKGSYFVQVVTNKGTVTRRIIKD